MSVRHGHPTFITTARKDTRKARLTNLRLTEADSGWSIPPLWLDTYGFFRHRRKLTASRLEAGLRLGAGVVARRRACAETTPTMIDKSHDDHRGEQADDRAPARRVSY